MVRGMKREKKRRKAAIGSNAEFLEEARINELPDGILVDIISLLETTHEAVRTCAICKRWRDLWKQVNRINFTIDQTIIPIKRLTVNDVSKFLESHQRESLVEFKIHSEFLERSGFFVDPEVKRVVDTWLVFAMRKGVQRLDIDLEGRISCLPYDYLTEKIFKSPVVEAIVFPKFLKHLSFNFLKIDGNLVEQFLSNCQFLEHLCISGSVKLKDLRIVGSSLKLKFLQVSNCPRLGKVDIFAPNLESFVFDGIKQGNGTILINHAPALVNVSLGDKSDYINGAFQAISRYCPQLETLNLDWNANRMWLNNGNNGCIDKLPEFSELTRLKELSLSYNVVINDVEMLTNLDLSHLTCLVERSPLLRKFSFELSWRNDLVMGRWDKKLAGFIVSTSDTRVAMYLLENANILRKLFEKNANLFKEDFEKFISERPSEFETTLFIKENVLMLEIEEYLLRREPELKNCWD